MGVRTKMKYKPVTLDTMPAEKKREMFLAALRTLRMCIGCKNTSESTDRLVSSTLAFHLMKAEGRKNCYQVNTISERWFERNQELLNEALAEFRKFLLAWITHERAGEQAAVRSALSKPYLN